MYLTDLAFIEEGTPNYTEDGLVNFSKMRMVSFPGQGRGASKPGPSPGTAGPVIEHSHPAAWGWLLQREPPRVPERQRGRQHWAGPRPALPRSLGRSPLRGRPRSRGSSLGLAGLRGPPEVTPRGRGRAGHAKPAADRIRRQPLPSGRRAPGRCRGSPPPFLTTPSEGFCVMWFPVDTGLPGRASLSPASQKHRPGDGTGPRHPRTVGTRNVAGARRLPRRGHRFGMLDSLPSPTEWCFFCHVIDP